MGITRWFGAGGSAGAGVNPTDVGYDLILLLGQSNMSGRGTADATRYDMADPRVWQYGAAGTYASLVTQAIEPLAHPDTVALTNGLGPGLHFARWYLGSVPTNRRVLLVPAAYGGTPLSTTATPLGWRRGVSDNLYAQALAQAAAALTAAGANSRIVAALWVHGEQDGSNSTTGAQYQTDFDALIAGLRTDLGIPTLPFVIGGMVPEGLSVGTRTAIQTVQSETPYRLAYTAFTAGITGKAQGDNLHYLATGYRDLARSMFDAYLLAKARTAALTPAVPAAPTSLAASSVTDTGLTLTWTAPSGIVASYVVEQKLTSGSTWTQIGTPSATTLAVTGLTASTSYDFRVAAVNSAGTGTASSVLTQATTSGVTTYAADNFNRANGAPGSTPTGSYAWTAVGINGAASGTWAVTSNQLALSGATGDQSLVVNDGQANGTVSVKCNQNDGGLVFRGVDGNNFLMLWADSAGYKLMLRNNTWTQLASSGTTPAAGDVLSVVLNGSSITWKVNGTTLGAVTNTNNQSATRHGVRQGNGAGTFDDFSHTSVAA